MGQDPPGWYYVGNGQLRYKFGDFWTDQYRTIGHSERAVPAASIESSDPVPAHTSPNVRLPHPRTPRVLIAVCAGLLGLGVGGGLLKPDIRHEWVSWAAQTAVSTRGVLGRGNLTLGDKCAGTGSDDSMLAVGTARSEWPIVLYWSVQKSPNLYRSCPLPT